MTALPLTRPAATRLPVVLVASAAVAAAVAVGTAALVEDEPAPATRATTVSSVQPGGYDAMQDYVDALVYWHQHPEWMPNR